MHPYPPYSVAIRTLGTSGEMFIKLIDSLKKQTLAPSAIHIYIAEGYSLPSPVADEKYIYCKKGMVAQRSLPFDELDSPFVLFCDDDMFLPEDAVEKMFHALLAGGFDAVSTCVFFNQDLSPRLKAVHALLYGEWPAWNTRWAYRIRRSSYYNYAIHPGTVMETQSFPGGCFLIKKAAYLAVHFEDERWMDSFHYALGDDQLFSYKLYRYGFRSAVHFDTGIIHLDAQSGRMTNPKEADKNQLITRILMWHRSIYRPDRQNGFWKPLWDVMALSIHLMGLYAGGWAMKLLGKCAWPGNIRDAVRSAKRVISTDEFKQIPEWKTVR